MPKVLGVKLINKTLSICQIKYSICKQIIVEKYIVLLIEM